MIYLHPLSWLQPGIKMCTFPQHRIHKLASLQEARVRYPNKVKSLLYPFTDVETYLDSSVDRTQFQLFHPCMNDLLKAEKLFCSSPSHKIDYYVSAERMDHSPALKQPEVCFIGRSNVGKSSLVKCLFSLSPNVEVRISKTPGHTKKMNFFKVGRAFTIVDMPGYGYKAPRDFVEMVEPYLYSRKTLVRTFILVDGSVGLQKTDHIALEMCEETGSPYVVRLFKKFCLLSCLSPENTLHFKDELNICFPQIKACPLTVLRLEVQSTVTVWSLHHIFWVQSIKLVFILYMAENRQD
ncbi:GTP-binding protein 8-like isoform X1 [Corythoichthys intestinalis]|uniref:GTP-binding protein 8-like isoform X1 n=1 Tax=Corythoichthys intestinalis TaxID=161448 RepID=UPI0025A550BE|nr:GTP-binding protein 8-like isoform X1 [Corythoichthys intestinalis]XP_057685189.1 GTP-binding protein 8-like isoform X1 [Corythoichthys intestinalis]XP_057708294.1 GTP-binding protein 8-like isoform X1 [Corythoichthys intestinalis]XP_057708295.1 GTP-binding protein 8-like isoform X1 [Corythoichthys intestinalis]